MRSLRFLLLLQVVLCEASSVLSHSDIRDTSQNLHILPLGASITYGLHSSTGNGYRANLRDLLSTSNVTYLGTQCSGNMTNPNNEGHPGYVISRLQVVAVPDISTNPNVVLIYAGTNDMLSQDAVSNIVADLSSLLKYITKSLPDALVVICKLFDTPAARVQQRIDDFNNRLSAMQLPSKVVIADMSQALLATDYFSDGIHPNDSGYAKMANIFYETIKSAETNGSIPERQNYNTELDYCQQSTNSSSSTGSASTSAASKLGANDIKACLPERLLILLASLIYLYT